MNSKSVVARFSVAFIKNYRITTLLFLSILALGYLSYTRFLEVEGFPPVEVPVVIVEGSYFINDARRVDLEVTVPIEKAAAELAEVTRVTSTTSPVGAVIVAEFDEDLSSEKGAELMQKAIEKSVHLPEGAEIDYRTINAGAFDGKHDLIFNISGDFSEAELQAKALELAKEVEKSPLVAQAENIPVIEAQLNPLTGQSLDVATGFNRVGVRDDEAFRYENAAAIGVVRKSDAGVVDLSDDVKEKVSDYKKTGDLKGFTVTYGGDVSPSVLEQLTQLEGNAGAGLLVGVLITLCLIGWRASIVAGIFIPLVFAAVLIALYMIGYTLNIISLFALVLALGMFVDNATVVIDAMERAKAKGHKGLDAIYTAVGSVGTSVIAGTWTNMLVFVPMLYISGVLGKFIILIPVTVITALAVSLFLAFTIVPWLGNIFIRDKRPPSGQPRDTASRLIDVALNGPGRQAARLSLHISRLVHDYVGRPWKTAAIILGTIALVIYGASFAAKLDFSVFPSAKDTDQIFVTIDFDESTTLVGAESITQEFEQQLLDEAGEDLTAVTYFGANEKNALLVADLTTVVDRDRTAPEISEAMQNRFATQPGARITVRPATVGPPVDDYQLIVRVKADSDVLLKAGTADVKTFLESQELADDESVTEVVVDRFDVLAKIDGSRFAQVRAKISDPEKTNLVLDLQKAVTDEYTAARLDGLSLRSDAVAIDLGQEGENVESFESAALALAIALIVMYGLLVLQFNSYTQPLLIFLAIPLSFPVLFPALYVTNNSLSFFVMLGIISLAGVVVNNTIVLVDQANEYRRDGRSAREAISMAVSVRFRALLATSLTTIAGLLPLALSDPFWEPLAYTIIFGLSSSVVLVIMAFPAFYVVAEAFRERVKRLGQRSS